MKTIKLQILLTIIVLMFFSACKNSKTRTSLLPAVTGKAGEVVLVMNDNYWESAVGEKWKKICNKSIPYLPQAEPMFDLIRIPQKALTSIFKTHRNIILTEITDSVTETKLTIQHDLWAKPQTVITIICSNKTEYLKYLNKNSNIITNLLLNTELKRITNNYKQFKEASISKQLKKNHHIDLIFPKGYKIDVDSTEFIWITHETPLLSQGIIIYYYNYLDTFQLNKDSLVAKRNEILKTYVHGTLPGSYMTTVMELPFIYRQFYRKDRYFAEIKGLWKVENDFMGGSFINFSTIDKKRNRIVTVDGYLYSPKYDKRNYMRQIEAIAYSLKLLD